MDKSAETQEFNGIYNLFLEMYNVASDVSRNAHRIYNVLVARQIQLLREFVLAVLSVLCALD